MKTKLTVILITLISFVLNFAIAQTPTSKISGTITDGAKPADGATVILLTAKDSAAVKTGLANADGSFVFQNLKDDSYIIKVTYAGYKNYQSGPLVVSAQQPVTLPPIALIASSKTLGEVGVTAQKSYIEQKIDRTVVNVNALISNNGANALEVLEKTPGVQVDENGIITFKGKTGVMIMIDDKPTYLSAADLATYLRSLPAASLGQIELMDNPPAKYDAAGNGGVINIKLRKNTIKGFNAVISANYGAGYYAGRNSENLNLNYRIDKVNLFTSLSYGYTQTFRRLEIDRSFYDAAGNPTSFFKDFSYFRPSSNNTDLKAGVDFYASPKTTFGIVLTGTLAPSHDTSPVNSFIYNKSGGLDSTVNTNNNSRRTFKSGGVNLNYSYQFDKTGKALTFDMDYIRDISGNDQTFVNNTFLPDGSLISSQTLIENTPSYIDIYAAKSDFSVPLKKGKFEAGVKASYVSTDNAANYFNLLSGIITPDYNNTNRFLYKENINAGYVSYNQSFNRFSVQAGLRLENTNGNGHQLGNAVKKDSAFARHYTDLFPTAYFSYKLDTTGQNVMVLSYGRRVGRPNYSNLNPFIFFVDKFSRFQGNPFLKPQFTDIYKLAFSFKSLLTVALSYNYTADYQVETINQSGDIFISTSGNIGQSKNINLSVNTNLQPAKWWSVNLYAEVYHNVFAGMLFSTTLNQSLYSFSANANNQFTMGRGWSAELSADYESRRVNGQFIAVPTGRVNAGLQKKVMNNKGTIRLSARDIFHTFNASGVITDVGTATSSYHNFLDTRVTTLGLSYSFGKSVNNIPGKRETGSADSEQGRAH